MKKKTEDALEKVRKSNALIDGQHKLDLYEQRILLTILSKVGYDDDVDKRYRVKWSEITTATKGFVNTYNKVVEVCDSLQDKVIIIDKTDKNSRFHFIAQRDIDKNDQYIDFELSSGMRRQLLDLLTRGHFTIFNLQCVLSLPSAHSTRLYEILRSRSFMKQPVEISLDDLKWSLGLPESGAGYKNFSDFRRFILDKAKGDLAKTTDIKFTYKPVKTGRKVSSILFTVTENKKYQSTIQGAVAKEQVRVLSPGAVIIIGGCEYEYTGSGILLKEGGSIPSGQLLQLIKEGKAAIKE